MAALLQLNQATIKFGGLTAVNAVDFTVGEGELCGLIGPNGAGKTTVFNLMTGVYQPTAGSIIFNGRPLAGLRVNEIVERGIARTFQNIRLFGSLSVFDNVRVACNLHHEASPLQALVRMGSFKRDEAATAKRVEDLLEIFNLRRFRDAPAKSLPYGEQRRLEIVRCLATKPKLLLLDEPAAGMNYGEAEGLKTQIRWLRDTFDLTVVLVEHNMQVVMGVCEDIHVLDHGETIAHGTPGEVKKHPKVLAAYLGEEHEEEGEAAPGKAVESKEEKRAEPDEAELT